MRRYGIRSQQMLGLGVPTLRSIARSLGRDHALALELWRAGYLEARLLASMIDEPGRVTAPQMERWARDFDSWALCDGCCQELFSKSRLAWPKAFDWSRRPEEFVKRAGFALVAQLAVHDREATDVPFLRFLSVIEREATDGRPYVRKGVNWSLRQIGKRNPTLRRAAIVSAERIRRQGSPAGRWIASDALRELRSPSVRRRVRRRAERRR